MQKAFKRKLRLAEKHLSAKCPAMGNWIASQGRCLLIPQWEREPFEALVRAVAFQQLHGKAAESILGRLLARFPDEPFPSAKQLSRVRIDTYRKCGFSQSKTETILGIAKAREKGLIPDRETANEMSDEALIECLTELRGIGRWTVEMLLIFTMGRLDVMPIDDFGVRSGLMQMYGLSSMPKKEAFAEYTDTWGPFRSIGAWYLWRFADFQKAASRAAAQNAKASS